mgnify:FL=1
MPLVASAWCAASLLTSRHGRCCFTCSIDDNVTNSLVNVTTAHQELWKVWRGVSGNRKLIIQMFLVFIVFAILFLVFFV